MPAEALRGAITVHVMRQIAVIGDSLLMGIEIRRFPSIDAFSRFSGTAIACSTGLFLELARQLLDSTAAASGRGRASVGGGVAAGPWRRLEKASLTPSITRGLVPANTYNT